MTAEEVIKLLDMIKSLAKAPLSLEDDPGQALEHVREYCDMISNELKLKLTQT